MAMPEMDEVKDLALKYDKATLGRMAQMGQVSPTLAVMAGMMRDRIVQSEMKPPEQTVAEEIMQPMGQRMGLGAAAQMPQQPQQPQPRGQGIDQVPIPETMFDEQRMAGGGIVAFQAGGQPPSFAGMYTNLSPDIEALRTVLGAYPTESAEERAKRRREEQAIRLMEIGLGIAGGESPYFASNLKGALPGIRGAAEDIRAQRKEDVAQQMAQRAETGKLLEGVLGTRGKAAEAAAAEGRLQKELTSRETTSKADREAKITAANIAAGKPTDMRFYADMVVKAEKGDPQAKTIVEGIDRYLTLSGLGRAAVAAQGVGVQQQRVDLDLYNKAVEYTDSQIGRGGPQYAEFRRLQKLDKENAAKGEPTNLAEEFEASIRNKYMSGVQGQRPAQSGAAPSRSLAEGQGAPAKPSPPPAAVSMLKANPSDIAKQQFDEVFGAGAAARALASQ